MKVEGPKGGTPEEKAAELLAYMYDRSLDAFVPHNPPDPLAVYPNRTGIDWSRASLGETSFAWISQHDFAIRPAPPQPRRRPS